MEQNKTTMLEIRKTFSLTTYGVYFAGHYLANAYKSKDEAWENGRGGYLFLFDGFYFQMSENQTEYLAIRELATPAN